MKQPGVYESGLFGDMVLPAIAVGSHKMILVFNTNKNSPHDPISVISAVNFGGYLDSQILIILAYNLAHFESMRPASEDDQIASKNLAKMYLQGKYTFNRSDILNLIDIDDPESVEHLQTPFHL